MSKSYDMKLSDIRRALRSFRYDPKYRNAEDGARVSLRALASMCGISHQYIYDLMDETHDNVPTERVRRCIAFGIMQVWEGLRWRRRDRKWYPSMPDGSLPRIPPELAHLHRHAAKVRDGLAKL